jgi:hypothetical protein
MKPEYRRSVPDYLIRFSVDYKLIWYWTHHICDRYRSYMCFHDTVLGAASITDLGLDNLCKIFVLLRQQGKLINSTLFPFYIITLSVFIFLNLYDETSDIQIFLRIWWSMTVSKGLCHTWTFQSLLVTWCTTSVTFNNCTLCHTVFACFVFIWKQTATCATYSINWLVLITKIKSVYSAVRTGSLNKVACASSLIG